ncbi:Lon-like ATP-dependent protease [Volucribacter psittacicida]|uniref:endopeptidase La n=1 Tax=Volucribacter psittacicida TaxID=203482 RepID=A0A4R1G2W0_9PAST|nr:Lon protease family protein [Volucribacter psittacicida]TCK01968.1 Lon-like ATP-dependent protease [Volucribacter psittacicida]
MSLSLSSQYCLDYQQLVPQLLLSEQAFQCVDYMALQPRAVSCLRYFLQNPTDKLLLLKSNEWAENSQFIENFVQQNSVVFTPQNSDKSAVAGVKYVVKQGDETCFPQVQLMPAQSVEDNFVSKYKVAKALYFDRCKLLGCLRQHTLTKHIELQAGLVHAVNQGVLILNLSSLLAQFELWQPLKTILLTQQFDWYSLDPRCPLPCEIPSYPLQLKLILLGDREDLARFAELEPELSYQASYGEMESYFDLEQVEHQQLWANFVRTFAQQRGLPAIDDAGLNKLYQLLVRESENRYLVSIDLARLQHILSGASLYAEQASLSAVHFEQFFQQQLYQQSFLMTQTYADILHEQVYIATDGEVIGQVNGLSVVEYQGTPIVFGEPSRISCVVNFGDGEIVDVDRKNELAGNVHGKGMMIAEACLMGLLNLQSQLPFSASLVFEQSYTDIDGDSASLAIFCVLLSALADLPLPQSIAITGAIDQFGLVHPVGGINHKVEGFFRICQQRGLTGQQGVIIPSVARQQLSLSEEVVSAVQNKQFFIWAVEDVYQAIEILFKRDLIEAQQKNGALQQPALSYFITQRIELRGEVIHKKPWFNWFK